MNKTELISKVAEQAGLKKVEATKAVTTMFEILRDTLKIGEKVAITGFGTFRVVQRAAREGRNPQTGRPISIPATKVVRFKPAKDLKYL
ncbi:MAG: DNA-binding protein [Syntrophobacter sp. DG_60]|nr:MAG: DNA-binding protein [Syntrophobacter sp. DG_60]